MKIRNIKKKSISVFLGFWLWCGVVPSFFLWAQNLPLQLKEIEDLYKKGAYSIVLEKSLTLLNTRASRLTPSDQAFLHYHVGMAYKKNDNKEMSVDYFKKLERIAPTSEYLKKAYLELAEIFKGDYFQRETFLDKLFINFPRTPEAVIAGIILSKDYLQLKNYKKALPVLETLVNLWQNANENPELYILLATAYAGIDDYNQALVYVRLAEKKILPSIQNNPDYLFTMGRALYYNLNFDNAITYLENLLNVFPRYKNSADASVMLALSYEKSNKLLYGAISLIKALKQKPPEKNLYTLYLNLGRMLGNMEEKDFVAIKENYPLYTDTKKMLSLVEKNSQDPEERKIATILLSGELKKSNDLEKAIENIYEFLKDKRDPVVEKMFKTDLDVYLDHLDKQQEVEQLFWIWMKMKQRKSFLSNDNLLHFGDILYRMGLFINASEVYLHILKYQMYTELWPIANFQLARIYFQMGKYKSCLDYIAKLKIESEPERSEFNYYKAISYEQLKQMDCLQQLLDSVEINTIFTIFQYHIIDIKAAQLEKQKKYPEALALYQSMTSFRETSKEEQGKLLITIADIIFKQGDLEAALKGYQLAEPLQVNLDWVLYRIVTILRMQDKKAEANEVLKKLKKIKPGSFWLQQLEKYGN